MLQGKRLLLLKKIALSIGWVDMGVFAQLRIATRVSCGKDDAEGGEWYVEGTSVVAAAG